MTNRAPKRVGRGWAGRCSTYTPRGAVSAGLMLVVLMLAALFPTASAQAQDSRPNLLFLFVDDFAPDAIGALGNSVVKTPALDELVAQSTSFSNAYNQGAWTGAVCRSSRDMLESGLFLWNAEDDAAGRIRDGQGATRLFRDNGYDTYFAGKQHLSGELTPADVGFETIGTVRPAMPLDYLPAGSQAEGYYGRPGADGSDTWDSTDTTLGGFWELPDPERPDQAVHWTEVLATEGVGFLETARNDSDPFYMQLSFNAPHDPRQAPAEYLDMYSLDEIEIPDNSDPAFNQYIEALGLDTLRDELVAPFPRSDIAIKTHLREYYAAISHLDSQIELILDKLDATNQRDNTYIILAGDHGLAVGQHGLMGKQNMFEHSMRTPLLISGPGIAKGATNEARVYYQDAMPTMFELAGIPVPSAWQFRSLVPILEGQRTTNYAAIYGAYSDRDNGGDERRDQRMVVQDDHKLILYPELDPPVALLYDLENDPLEMTDLIGAPGYEQRRSNLFAALLSLQGDTGDPLDLTTPFGDLFAVTTTRIEAESYAASTDTDPGNLGGAPEFPAPADVWPHANGPAGQRDGHVVGRTRGGETLTYTDVQVDEGTWRIAASWASGHPDPGGMRLYVDDNLAGDFDATANGQWWVFESSVLGDVALTSGPHTLRVEFTDTGQINFDYLELTRTGDLPTRRIEAESYSASTDTDPQNLGGAPEFPAPADVWPHASGPEGQRDGHVVGRTRGGETLSYDNVAFDDGIWSISASWASGDPDPGGMNLYVDNRLVGAFDATGTGHWWVFESSSFGDIELAGGNHDLRVEFTDAGQINFDYLELTRIGDRVGWTLTCPKAPSWVRVGDEVELTAAIEPAQIAADAVVTWQVGGTTTTTPQGVTSIGPISWPQPTAGRETGLVVSATVAATSRSIACPGVVVVESDATVVSPGQALQPAIRLAGAGATVYLDRGVHVDNINVRLLDDQTVTGFTDPSGESLLSVVDGTGTESVIEGRRTAFLSNPGEDHPQGVTIRNLEFTNWTTYQEADGSLERSGFHGVIHIQSATTTPRDKDNCTAERRNPTGWGDPIDWTIDGVHIHNNNGAGIVLSSGVRLLDSVITDNAHIGIGGTFVKDVLIDKVTVERNALHPDVIPNSHAGGLKITRANGVQILSSTFVGNGGPGIWLDIDTWGNRVVNNVASDNTTFGIFQEISWASEIRDNTATNNGTADILVAESGGFVNAENTTITLNVVENNRLSDDDVTTRALDRSCDYRIFRAADGDTILPSTAISGYVVEHNAFYNNGPDGIGADALVEPGPWVPRTVRADGPAEVPGADGPVEAMVTATCLANNGRVDINIVNTGAVNATYRIEFGQLSPRQRTVVAGDWWRMPVTGRTDGLHDLVITREGVVIVDQPVTVSCDSEPPVITSPEVQVVNACRDGRGYLIFQFANATADPRGWVIEFEGVPNRSTSGAAYGASVRAVTGRANGIHNVTIRSTDERTNFDVTVDC